MFSTKFYLMKTIGSIKRIFKQNKLLFLFLLFPFVLNAQDTLLVSKIIDLPEASNYYSVNTVIFNEARFKWIFSSTHADSLPEIDFQKYKLLGMPICDECIENKEQILIINNLIDSEGNYHIVGCRKKDKKNKTKQYWFLIEKGKYPEIEYTPLLLPYRYELPYYAESIIDNQQLLDSIIPDSYLNQKIDFEKYLILTRTEGGDCHARYEHEVSLDTFRKTLRWKVYNIYGGCRAAGIKDFIIQVPKPPEDYDIVFETEMVN